MSHTDVILKEAEIDQLVLGDTHTAHGRVVLVGAVRVQELWGHGATSGRGGVASTGTVRAAGDQG